MKINSVQRLYHGTDKEFDLFDFECAQNFKDFGKGFYLTSNFRQAQHWAQKKARNKQKAYIYCYNLGEVEAEKWNILELLQYDKQWVDFISESRLDGMETDHDIIYDRMADNRFRNITDTLQKYTNKEMQADEVISVIKQKDDNADQYCFKNEKSLSLLKDRKKIIRCRDENGKWIQL